MVALSSSEPYTSCLGLGAGINSAIFDELTQIRKEERGHVGDAITDRVLEASEDSFPASDPPGWTSRIADIVSD